MSEDKVFDKDAYIKWFEDTKALIRKTPDSYCLAYAIGNILSWTQEDEKERYWANDLEQRKLHAQLMMQAGFDPSKYLWRMPVPNPINDFQRFTNALDRLANEELDRQRSKARDVRIRA
ncbi:MAG: hypothetical protein KGI38_12380 [Thaumarchaeota archaeon]|nr:hypothetical protein [Nitrososphaerota archaeon]